MDIDQVLLLALGAPATYLLLYLLLRLEARLPEPVPKVGRGPAVQAAGGGAGPAAGTAPGGGIPRPGAVPAAAPAGDGPTWTIAVPVPAGAESVTAGAGLETG
jgi:hypothetical protein